MYYITHELKDWPGYGKLEYKYGTAEICASRYDEYGRFVPYKTAMRKGAGWDKKQIEGSTNNAEESYMYYVPYDDANKAKYTIEIAEFTGTDKVQVYANDVLVGEFDEAGTYSFVLNELKAQELLTIKFKSEGSSFTIWKAVINKEGQG